MTYIIKTLYFQPNIWRKLMGVEPTRDMRMPHSGFEDRALHRQSLASDGNCRWLALREEAGGHRIAQLFQAFACY